MKRIRKYWSFILACVCFAFVLIYAPDGHGAVLKGQIAHHKMIYPIVRITAGEAAGSGTIIYSKKNEAGVFETFVLTNHHVVAQCINVKEEWDSTKKKDIKKETLDVVYVEVFQYKHLSTPIGTLRVEAEIVGYNADEDMALIKLASEDKQPFVAELYPRGKDDEIHVMDESVAVGCSLAYPPLPSSGEITRKNMILNSFPYHMSSSQIIYGNSGGAMFDETGRLVGIPSMVAAIGWSSVVTHMGFFIPIERVYEWWDKIGFDTEKGLAKKEIEEEKEK